MSTQTQAVDNEAAKVKEALARMEQRAVGSANGLALGLTQAQVYAHFTALGWHNGLIEAAWEAYKARCYRRDAMEDWPERTTCIHSNGSKWAYSEPDGIEVLMRRLAQYPLEPRYNGATQIGNRTRIVGNFFDVSHVFDIETTDKELAQRVLVAMNRNRFTPAYKAAVQAIVEAPARWPGETKAQAEVRRINYQREVEQVLTSVGGIEEEA